MTDNFENRKRTAIAMTNTIELVMEQLGSVFGVDLATLSAMGAIVAVGRANSDGSKRWQIVLATNEAAAELKEWAGRESRVRIEAMKKLDPESGTIISQFEGM
jgi:hypothetical protein